MYFFQISFECIGLEGWWKDDFSDVLKLIINSRLKWDIFCGLCVGFVMKKTKNVYLFLCVKGIWVLVEIL